MKHSLGMKKVFKQLAATLMSIVMVSASSYSQAMKHAGEVDPSEPPVSKVVKKNPTEDGALTGLDLSEDDVCVGGQGSTARGVGGSDKESEHVIGEIGDRFIEPKSLKSVMFIKDYKDLVKLFRTFSNIFNVFEKETDINIINEKLKKQIGILLNLKEINLITIWSNLKKYCDQLIMNNLEYHYGTYYKTSKKEEIVYNEDLSIENFFSFCCKNFDELYEKHINLTEYISNKTFLNYFHVIIYIIHRIQSLQTLNIVYFINELTNKINKIFYDGFIEIRNKKIYDKICDISSYQIGSRYVIFVNEKKTKFVFVNLINSFTLKPDF